jgi:ribosomal 30S subunit maturation factor RimM
MACEAKCGEDVHRGTRAALGGYARSTRKMAGLPDRTAPTGKGVVVAKFRGIDDRNAAEALNGISL